MRLATLETGGRDSAKTGEGGWASWTAQALFAWTRTHDEPGKSGTFGYMAAGLLCADVSFTRRALARFWAVGAKASHGNNRLLDACFRVFVRCVKKKIFNSFTSFSRWKWFILFTLFLKLRWKRRELRRCHDLLKLSIISKLLKLFYTRFAGDCAWGRISHLFYVGFSDNFLRNCCLKLAKRGPFMSKVDTHFSHCLSQWCCFPCWIVVLGHLRQVLRKILS